MLSRIEPCSKEISTFADMQGFYFRLHSFLRINHMRERERQSNLFIDETNARLSKILSFAVIMVTCKMWNKVLVQ